MPDVARMIDEFQYSLIVMLAGVHWSLQKALIMAGYTVKVVNQWLIDNAFVPLISQTNDSVQLAVGVVFVVALLVLGITYLLAAFIRLEVVNPKSAIVWYAAGALFFAVGPSLYAGMNSFRLTIGETMYLSVLSSMSATTGTAFNSLSLVQSDDLDMGALCDQFDVYLPGATGAGAIDGLDITMAYLRAHPEDVMGYPQPVYSPGCGMYFLNPNPSTWTTSPEGSVVPMDWNLDGGYFNGARSPITWDALTDTDRDASVAMAGASQQRAFTAWPLILFGLAEQIVHLLVTIAMGITFVSFGVAILFAFFKKTESIAQNMINQWIELIVQTVAIALIQALVMGFFLAGTAAGSAPAVVGISLICLVFIVITLFAGVKAVWNSFNRLFNAMGQAAGGTILSPGAAAVTVGAAAVGTAALGAAAYGGAMSVGSSAMAGATALRSGATPAQAAGLTFGGVEPVADAARAITRLPALRGTPLGDAAEQFTEGATVRRVARDVPLIGGALAPRIGAQLLSDYDPANAEYDDKGRLIGRPMLVPAVGERLEQMTYPIGKSPRKAKPAVATDDEALEWQVDDDGELTPMFTRVKRKRIGMFTPIAPSPTEATTDEKQERERETYADDMRGEELEQHLSDMAQSGEGRGASNTESSRIDNAAALLEASAEALTRAGLMLGQLRVTGGENVAGVMGDVLRLAAMSGDPRGGIDHLTVGALMADALGVTPQAGRAPITDDLARFGMFADSAARVGLSGDDAETVVREVKTSPEGRLTDERREALIDGAHQGGMSRDEAEREVDALEAHARRLPDAITAYGYVSVPAPQIAVEPDITVTPEVNVTVETPPDASGDDAMHRAASMSGNGSVMGGGV